MRYALNQIRALDAPSDMKACWLFHIAIGLAAMYFFAGAYALRFRLDSMLLPHTSAPASPFAPELQPLGHSGELFVRRYGVPRLGCVLFFPGRHGNLPAYQRQLFPAFLAHGIEVLEVAYPGQDGAPGTASLAHMQALTTAAISAAGTVCPEHSLVLYGRSLGAMMAAYSAAHHRPAGLILEGAAPSLSSAVRMRLSVHWYTAPWVVLPVSSLLRKEFSLAQALTAASSTPVVSFQGTADIETPLRSLQSAPGLGTLRIVVVPGGTHSDTYKLARDRIVETAVSMLREPGT